MSDLLHRLRNPHTLADTKGVPYQYQPNALHAEAAEEIERLRIYAELLKAAARKHLIVADYDYPGDTPIRAGWSCIVCRGDWGIDMPEEHAEGCVLAANPNPAGGTTEPAAADTPVPVGEGYEISNQRPGASVEPAPRKGGCDGSTPDGNCGSTPPPVSSLPISTSEAQLKAHAAYRMHHGHDGFMVDGVKWVREDSVHRLDKETDYRDRWGVVSRSLREVVTAWEVDDPATFCKAVKDARKLLDAPLEQSHADKELADWGKDGTDPLDIPMEGELPQ